MLGYFILSPGVLFPNFLVSHVRVRRTKNLTDELNLLKKFCTSCGRENCRRHKPEPNVLALRPWLTIRVPEKVNMALEEFFNLVLQEFISSWYSVLSKDEEFSDEIRKSLRFIVSVLLRRLERVDIPSLITGRVLNTALTHLDYCLQVTNRDVPVADVEQSVLDIYGPHLHCALRNRKSELEYLGRFSDKVFPFILPPHSVKCESLCVLLREVLSGKILLPAMDVLADPDIVNNILLLLLDKSPLHKCTDPPSPLVPILGFTNIQQQKIELDLKLSLSDILADNNLLYLFIQFMKSESSVNVIQFYLSIEEFNDDILTPELSKEQMQDLHRTLRDLYNNYIDPSSINCIGFDDDIVSQLKDLCEGDAEGVVRLQTTTPLFKAYEHAYDLLEHVFLPLFHQSNEYFTVVWGERHSTELQRSSSKTSKNPIDPLSLSGIGNRLKTVLRGNTVEGRPVSEVVDDMEIGSLATSLSDTGVERMPNHPLLLDDGPLRDLSAWRVSIPEIVARPDPDNQRKTVYMFNIEVRRVDVLENDFEMTHWTNCRRYNEFYVLEQKLVEFHGVFEDAQLPSKKTFVQKSRAFLESQRESFEQYLQKLLTKPVLRNSELLYSFLDTDIEFTTSFLEVNLGKKVKSGALKLVKERGQHIDAFLKSFLLSTENPKSRPSKWSDRDSDTLSISSEKGSIYSNNANCDLTEMPTTSVDSSLCSVVQPTSLGGVYDAVIYLVVNLYNAPVWVLRLLMVMRTVVRNTVDTFLDWYLGQKIEKVLQEYHLVKIIHLLRDALFFDNDPPRTDEDKHLRQSAALSQLMSFIPSVFAKVVGSENYEKGTRQFFSFLQYPRLNKQLSYMLLDIAIEELFPELFPETTTHDAYHSSAIQ